MESHVSSTQEVSLEDHFPIRTLSLETGVNTVTLRAWERRYGLLKPVRTPKGHRLYNQKDVETVHNILHWIQKGVPVGKVKALLSNNKNAEELDCSNELSDDDVWSALRNQFIESSTNYQESKLLSDYQALSSQYPVDIIITQLIEPVVTSLFHLGDNGTAFRFFTSCLTKQITVHLNSYKHQGKKRPSVLVVNAASGSVFWSGLMALLLQARGYDPIWLSDVHNPNQWMPLLSGLNPSQCLCVCESVLPDGMETFMTELAKYEGSVVITGSEVWFKFRHLSDEVSNVSIYSSAMEGVMSIG
ncbi:MerR family transcriptional regulator [Marinomonas mediterranea]|nr:MerR family transcriptional regulator [Marinomonas mediterranea]WCN15428.1 MerR family transcriptional regulator [Marinomonas mediterranea]